MSFSTVATISAHFSFRHLNDSYFLIFPARHLNVTQSSWKCPSHLAKMGFSTNSYSEKVSFILSLKEMMVQMSGLGTVKLFAKQGHEMTEIYLPDDTSPCLQINLYVPGPTQA